MSRIVRLGPEEIDLETEAGRRLYAIRVLPCLRVRYWGAKLEAERTTDLAARDAALRRQEQASAKATALMRWI